MFGKELEKVPRILFPHLGSNTLLYPGSNTLLYPGSNTLLYPGSNTFVPRL